MPKQLLIVESPNKKQKLLQHLESLFGSGQWMVAASVGHVQDLPEKELGINREKNYAMSYQVNPDKQKVVAELKRLTREVGPDRVILATDPDREGEAIAWHLSRLLGIPPDKAQRATFQEITKPALKAALENKRTLNMNLVKAQEARRAIDRLAGYEISSIVSRKTGKLLSAGRVQSVALKLIVEREKSIGQFADQFSYKLRAEFLTPKQEVIKAQYGDSGEQTQTVKSPASIQAYLATAPAKAWRVLSIETNPVQRAPAPAFTTSSLQQEGIRKLSQPGDPWSAKRVMEVAQALFAAGHITYMRTDSPNLSAEAIAAIQHEVLTQFGARYFQQRRFPVKGDAQEAHEAIRPTHMESPQAGSTTEQQALYRLIYTRAMASQMKPAEYSRTVLSIGTGHSVDLFQAKASVLIFDGYRAIYTESEEDQPEEESTIAPITPGTPLSIRLMQGRQTYQQPPKRFDEASLVKSLEHKGIGRPSTYATILHTIQKRTYVAIGTVPARKLPVTLITLLQGRVLTSTEQQSIGGDKGKLISTETGLMLAEFLQEHFASLIDYSFTAEMEKQLDQIVEGNRKFLDVIQTYDRTHQLMIQQLETAAPDAQRSSSTRVLGDYNGKPVRVGNSKTGTFLLYDKNFTTVPNLTADQLTLEIAISTLKASTNDSSSTGRQSFLIHKVGKYEVRQGKYGYYLTDGQTNAKLPTQFTTVELIKAINQTEAQKIMKSYADWKKKQPSKN